MKPSLCASFVSIFKWPTSSNCGKFFFCNNTSVVSSHCQTMTSGHSRASTRNCHGPLASSFIPMNAKMNAIPWCKLSVLKTVKVAASPPSTGQPYNTKNCTSRRKIEQKFEKELHLVGSRYIPWILISSVLNTLFQKSAHVIVGNDLPIACCNVSSESLIIYFKPAHKTIGKPNAKLYAGQILCHR